MTVAMIRWILLLCACLFLVYVLAPGGSAPSVDAVVTPAAPGIEPGQTGEITLESGEVWQVDRVISVAEPEPQTVPEIAFEPTDASDEDTTEAPPATGGTTLYVTGTRVNLRAGPSTNDAIVAALTEGTATELLGDAPDGWLEIRDRATGARGFMSGDFLSATAP